jgi:hypothetical protein
MLLIAARRQMNINKFTLLSQGQVNFNFDFVATRNYYYQYNLKPNFYV